MEWIFNATTNLCLCVVILISSLYIYGLSAYSYWKKRGVKYIEPLPLIGNYDKFILSKVNRAIAVDTIYKKFPEERYVGVFHYKSPVLILRDPVLIHRILTSDFDYFEDRIARQTGKLSNHLLVLTGMKWKNLRSKLTPVFSLDKLKQIMEELNCCNEYIDNMLDEKIAEGDAIEICELMYNYTTNLILSSAFGCDTKTLNSIETKTDLFMKKGLALFRFTFLLIVGFFTGSNSCKIESGLGINTMPEYIQNFILNFLRESIEYRKKNNVVRNDFLQVFIDLRKQDAEDFKKKQNDSSMNINGQNYKEKSTSFMDDAMLASNVCVFITAGFETTSNTLSNCLLELADNLDVQRKLRDEITRTMKNNKSSSICDDLEQLKYMDKVISETLRKYPVASGLIRTCTKEYKIPDSDVVIDSGISMYIPVYSIQRDSEYYPNPEIFDPERFVDENILERQRGTYLPFGSGPRACIGSNLAILQIKGALAHIVSRYKFKMTTKTSLPLEFSSKTLALAPKDGIWLKFEKLRS